MANVCPTCGQNGTPLAHQHLRLVRELQAILDDLDRIPSRFPRHGRLLAEAHGVAAQLSTSLTVQVRATLAPEVAGP